jgi:type IV secretory pathway VirJ component
VAPSKGDRAGCSNPEGDLPLQSHTSDQPTLNPDKPVQDMTLVELAEQLEKVTGWIESQHVREREARAAYDSTKREVDASVAQIRQYAKQLFDQQRKRMSAFGGMLGYDTKDTSVAAAKALKARAAGHVAAHGEPKMNIADAICAIWNNDRNNDAMTTEEIAAALPLTGWESNAAPTSLRSSINQALAKLSRVGRIIRYRNDGARISIRDTKSRARKYIAATKAPEVEE